MKVFLVMASTGSYEDYRRDVSNVFANRDDAETYIVEQKRHWDDVRRRSDLCGECTFHWETEHVKNKELFMEKALNYCPDAQFDWENKHMPCWNVIWEDQIPKWNIDEREVE